MLAALVALVVFADFAAAPSCEEVELRSEEIASIQREIEATTADIKALNAGDARAARMLELAEEYADLAQVLQIVAMSENEGRVTTWSSNTGDMPAPEPDMRASDAAASKALAISEYLVAHYPNHSASDRMLYDLAENHFGFGRAADALAELTRLVHRSPDSPYAPLAFVAIGDWYAQHRKFDDAIDWYSKATDPKFPVDYAWIDARRKLRNAYRERGDAAAAPRVTAAETAFLKKRPRYDPRMLRAERVAHLRKRIASLSDDNRKAACMLELAAEYRYESLEAHSPRGGEEKIDDVDSIARLCFAATIDRYVVEQLPDFPQRDAALYDMAEAYSMLGRKSDAREVWKALALEYPFSIRAPMARLMTEPPRDLIHSPR